MYLYIPVEIIQLLLFPKECFPCITTYNYFVSYVWCLLSVQGSKTTRNLHRHCFFFRKHVSSWCRFLSEYKWDYVTVMKKMFLYIIELFPNEFIVHGAVQGCYDTTLVAKNSKKIIGVQKWNNHSGNADCGDYLVGHHIGILGIIGTFKSRCICFLLSFRLITGKKINAQWKFSETGELERMNIWDVSCAQSFQLNEWVQSAGYKLRIVADAYFAKKPFIQPLLNRGIDVITNLREDAVAELKLEPQKAKTRGRKRIHGKQIKVKDLWEKEEHQFITVCLYGKVQTLEIVVADVKTLDLTKTVRVVVQIKKDGHFMNLASTDTTLTGADIVEIYGSRFSIEFAIRDVKQHTGFEEYRHQSMLPVLRFWHIAGVAYNIGKIALIKHRKSEWLKSPFEKGEAPWTSEFSLTKLRYCLRRYALAKLVFPNSALEAEPEKLALDKEAILDFVS